MTPAWSWRAVTRGVFAWLAVLLLIGGLGVARVGASVFSIDASYDDLTLMVQSDAAGADIAAAPLGDDDPGNDDPILGVVAQRAPVFRSPLPLEGQLAFNQRHSALKRALKPTGPPAELTL